MKPYKPRTDPSAMIKGVFGDLNRFAFTDNGVPNLGPNGNPVNNSKNENPNDGYWITL